METGKKIGCYNKFDRPESAWLDCQITRWGRPRVSWYKYAVAVPAVVSTLWPSTIGMSPVTETRFRVAL